MNEMQLGAGLGRPRARDCALHHPEHPPANAAPSFGLRTGE
jgi:hypothetical protein